MFSEANSPQFDTVFQTHFCNQSTFWVERNQNWNPSSSAQSQWSWWAPEKLLGKVPVVENGDQIDLVLTWTRDKSGLCWQSWSLRNLREHVPGRFLIWVVTLMSWQGFHLPCWPSGRFLFSLLLFTTTVFISRSLQLGQSSAAEQQTGGVQCFTERFRTDLQRADGKVKAPRQTNKNRSLGSLMDKHGALTGRERGLRIQDFSFSHQGAAQAIRY